MELQLLEDFPKRKGTLTGFAVTRDTPLRGRAGAIWLDCLSFPSKTKLETKNTQMEATQNHRTSLNRSLSAFSRSKASDWRASRECCFTWLLLPGFLRLCPNRNLMRFRRPDCHPWYVGGCTNMALQMAMTMKCAYFENLRTANINNFAWEDNFGDKYTV